MKKRITKIILCSQLLIFAASAGTAQNRTGEYVRGTNGNIIIKDTGRGAARRLLIGLNVGQPEPSCGYVLEGKAVFIAPNIAELVLTGCEFNENVKTVPEDEENAQICRLKFIFSGARRLIVEEGDHCSRCHGFSCEISGTFLRKARRVNRKRASSKAAGKG